MTMAYITILDSKDGTTVGDLLEMIGSGVLTNEDGVLKASKSYILEPGKYTVHVVREKATPDTDRC
jgi:hypothetical protein